MLCGEVLYMSRGLLSAGLATPFTDKRSNVYCMCESVFYRCYLPLPRVSESVFFYFYSSPYPREAVDKVSGSTVYPVHCFRSFVINVDSRSLGSRDPRLAVLENKNVAIFPIDKENISHIFRGSIIGCVIKRPLALIKAKVKSSASRTSSRCEDDNCCDKRESLY